MDEEIISESIKNPLKDEHIPLCLCDLKETMDGLAIACRKIICNDRMLTSIQLIEKFIFLQDVNFAFNALTDITPLQKLTLLQRLDCSYNRIAQIPQFTWPFLICLDLSHNNLTNLTRIAQPNLQVLRLNYNLISSLIDDNGGYILDEESFPRLHTIELRGNRFNTTLPELNKPTKYSLEILPHLRRIGLWHSGIKLVYLPENHISSLAVVYQPPDDDQGILKLNPLGSRMGLVPGLVALHLRNNGLQFLHGFTAVCFACLEYLNLRENKIDQLMHLSPLAQLPKLRCLVLSENPVEQVENYRLEVLVIIRTLLRLDKENYSAEEIEEATTIYEKRKKETEEKEVFEAGEEEDGDFLDISGSDSVLI